MLACALRNVLFLVFEIMGNRVEGVAIQCAPMDVFVRTGSLWLHIPVFSLEFPDPPILFVRSFVCSLGKCPLEIDCAHSHAHVYIQFTSTVCRVTCRAVPCFSS